MLEMLDEIENAGFGSRGTGKQMRSKALYLMNTSPNMPLVISKVGFGADLYKSANARSIGQRFAYGVAAVLVALLTGWLAHLAFRKR